jgi:hypothetical protein
MGPGSALAIYVLRYLELGILSDMRNSSSLGDAILVELCAVHNAVIVCFRRPCASVYAMHAAREMRFTALCDHLLWKQAQEAVVHQASVLLRMCTRVTRPCPVEQSREAVLPHIVRLHRH